MYRPIRKAFSSVDPSEMKIFSQVKDWWDPNGSMRALHAYNTQRILFIRKTMPMSTSSSHPLQNMKILDVGCGGGLLAESMARLGGQVTGLDANANSIHIAQAHLDQDPLLKEKLKYLNQSSEELPKEPTYDIITAMEVIEHVNEPIVFLDNLTDLLRPNGVLFLSTINQTPLSYFYTILLAEHLTRIVPIGTHHYEKYIKPKELQAMCQEKGLIQLSIQGVFYDPLFNTMLSVNNLQTNYMAAFLKQ